jgi:hypothetical protein
MYLENCNSEFGQTRQNYTKPRSLQAVKGLAAWTAAFLHRCASSIAHRKICPLVLRLTKFASIYLRDDCPYRHESVSDRLPLGPQSMS